MAEAHSFNWHGTGQSLLEAKLCAIDAARSSVCMEMFIFRDSEVGLRFRSVLAAAARRGVRVRLIVDAVGSPNRDPRSLRINFEIMLRIHDASLAATALQQFESDLAQRALPITCDGLQQGRSWWERLKQRLAYWFFARLDPELAALKLRAWHLRKNRFVQRVKHARRDDARRVE